jgi:hypothetical protein
MNARGRRKGVTARKTVRQGRPHRRRTAVAASAKEGVKKRIAALAGLSGAVCDDIETLQEVLNILRDKIAPMTVRLAALQTMQAASFSVTKFNACRPKYLAALRSVATDPDWELRQRVLGLLSREHDGYAQDLLIEGLKHPEKALVPPEKALQLLGYDVHADAYPVARKIVLNSPNSEAKLEALRILAADAASVPIFERILRSKKESPETRQLAASALHSLAPRKLQVLARGIVLDKAENDQLKATSLTALTQFGNHDAMTKDDALYKSVSRMKGKSGSAELKRGRQRFLAKYSR